MLVNLMGFGKPPSEFDQPPSEFDQRRFGYGAISFVPWLRATAAALG